MGLLNRVGFKKDGHKDFVQSFEKLKNLNLDEASDAINKFILSEDWVQIRCEEEKTQLEAVSEAVNQDVLHNWTFRAVWQGYHKDGGEERIASLQEKVELVDIDELKSKIARFQKKVKKEKKNRVRDLQSIENMQPEEGEDMKTFLKNKAAARNEIRHMHRNSYAEDELDTLLTKKQDYDARVKEIEQLKVMGVLFEDGGQSYINTMTETVNANIGFLQTKIDVLLAAIVRLEQNLQEDLQLKQLDGFQGVAENMIASMYGREETSEY